MALMAKLEIIPDHVPLCQKDRAMLIKSLQDFIAELGPHGQFADGNVSTMFIQAPEIPILQPIFSDNCGRLR